MVDASWAEHTLRADDAPDDRGGEEGLAVGTGEVCWLTCRAYIRNCSQRPIHDCDLNCAWISLSRFMRDIGEGEREMRGSDGQGMRLEKGRIHVPKTAQIVAKIWQEKTVLGGIFM